MISRASRALAGAVLCGVLVCACSATIEPPLTPLIPAATTMFAAPVGVSVTVGTSGIDGAGAGTFYWLTAAAAAITVTNRSQQSPDVDLSMLLKAPPCERERVQVQVNNDGAFTTVEADSVGGTQISLRMKVPLGRTAPIYLQVLTPSCRVPPDSRDLYAGLHRLQVS